MWETQTKLNIFVYVFHANRQASEITCLTKTSHKFKNRRDLMKDPTDL